MAKNLYNLTPVTAVNDSDLLHVNQGSVSSDKKVTKANLLKEVNNSINSLNNSLTQLIKTGVASVSNPIANASAGATGHFTVTVPTPSGYTLVGVIGYEGSGTGGFSYSDIYLTSNTSIEVYFRNNNTVAKSVTLWKAYVLFVKTL